MRYYIIAGEASGDLHGSNLIKELKNFDSLASIRCWGGEKMQAEGAALVKHYRELAFMGFVEVLKNLRTIVRNLRFCEQDILAYQPDALILAIQEGRAIAVCNGSYMPTLAPDLGAASWWVEDPLSRQAMHGMVQTLGSEADVDSYCSELQGVHATLLALLAFCTYHDITAGGVTLGCDNLNCV